MSSITSLPQVSPAAQLQPASAKAAPASESQAGAKTESKGDYWLRMANYGVGASGSVAGLVAIPHEVVQASPMIIQGARQLGMRAAVIGAASQGSVLGRGASALAKSSLFVMKNTDHLSKLSSAVMRSSTIGKAFSPAVAKTMTGKVLPTINAIGAGLSVLDNGVRFYRASQNDNTAGQVVAGTQIGLNVLGAVTGYLPGKAQLVSVAAGLGSLGLELAHQFGGLGK